MVCVKAPLSIAYNLHQTITKILVVNKVILNPHTAILKYIQVIQMLYTALMILRENMITFSQKKTYLNDLQTELETNIILTIFKSLFKHIVFGKERHLTKRQNFFLQIIMTKYVFCNWTTKPLQRLRIEKVGQLIFIIHQTDCDQYVAYKQIKYKIHDLIFPLNRVKPFHFLE